MDIRVFFVILAAVAVMLGFLAWWPLAVYSFHYWFG
jgi:hypothetical protein